MIKWINVKDELPVTSNNGYYIMSEPVLVFNGKQQVARRMWDEYDGLFYWRSGCSEGYGSQSRNLEGWCLTGVTHWVAIPNPEGS